VVAAVAATCLTLTCAVASHADGTTVATTTDARGDVTVTKAKGLTSAERRSIDLRRITIKRVDRAARVIVTLKDVRRVKKYDQMVFIRWSEQPGSPGGPWSGDLGFTSKGAGYVSYFSEDFDEVENCRVTVTVAPVKNQVAATVPWRCVPEGPLDIRVTSVTGHFQTDAPAYSRDAHRVPGRPTIT
jgi:hypothetical protein